MGAEQDYKLSVWVEPQPKKHPVEGEPYDVLFKIKNIGETEFPGIKISIASSWPIIGENSTVYNDLDVGSLPSGESGEYALMVTPQVAGFTYFSIKFPASYHHISGGVERVSYHNHLKLGNKKVFLYLRDEKRKITNNLVFDSIQAKSHEELLAKQEVDYARRALKWAIIAFVASVVFGLADIILTILFEMGII